MSAPNPRTDPNREELADRFQGERAALRSLAYNMLGSLSEAEDALQDTWLRLERADAGEIENLSGWLRTVLARVCLNRLRTRSTQREASLDVRLPDPLISEDPVVDPELEAMRGDAVGMAMMVVLDTLTPAERLAFVMHDVFGMPFADIAALIERSPDSTRQLASRGRRAVRAAAPVPNSDLSRQRQLADTFIAAAREGDVEALIGILDPEVVLRVDFGALPGADSRELRGAEAVVEEAVLFATAHGEDLRTRPVLVNGAVGWTAFEGGQPLSVMALTVVNEAIVAIDILADPERLGVLDLPSPPAA